MEVSGKQAERAELNVLVSDIAAGRESFSCIAYALAKKDAKTGYMFEMPAPHERYDAVRGEQARALAVQEGLPVGMGTLAGLVCVFESTNQPFDLAKHCLGDKVFYFLQQACPANDSSTGNEYTDFSIKVAHYAKASPLAQTAVMLDLLAMIVIDSPGREFMEWWDQPVMAMQEGDARVRERLILAMTKK
mgnify:CR=1 FL=1